MSSSNDEDVEIEWVWDPEDLDASDDNHAADAPAAAGPDRFRVRAWHLIFLLALVLATIGLAWWQWSRFQSGSGTFQNLGYAFQWPLFGIFFVYAYRMIVKYENKAREAKSRASDPDFRYQDDSTEFNEHGQPVVTEIDEDFLPSRPQLDVGEFNELNRQRRPQRNNHSEDSPQ